MSGDLKLGAACLRHIDRSQELLNRHAFHGRKGPAAICDIGTFPHAAGDWNLNLENTGREPLGKARLNRNISRLSGDKVPGSVAATSIGNVSFWQPDIRLVEYRTFDRPSALNLAIRPGCRSTPQRWR